MNKYHMFLFDYDRSTIIILITCTESAADVALIDDIKHKLQINKDRLKNEKRIVWIEIISSN